MLLWLVFSCSDGEQEVFKNKRLRRPNQGAEQSQSSTIISEASSNQSKRTKQWCWTQWSGCPQRSRS